MSLSQKNSSEELKQICDSLMKSMSKFPVHLYKFDLCGYLNLINSEQVFVDLTLIGGHKVEELVFDCIF